MKKGLTEVVFILDRSGSMGGLEADTIGGYNAMLEKQRKGEGEVVISTVLFDDKVEVLHDRLPIEKIEKMTDEEYYVRGCTALLDAFGGAIKHIGGIHKAMKEEERPEHTIFVVTTDGMENASRKYSYDKVKKMVEKKTNKNGWEFMFLGANMDAVSEGAKLGIRKERATQYCCDSVGTAVNFKAVSNALFKVRECGAMPVAWDAEIQEHLAESRK